MKVGDKGILQHCINERKYLSEIIGVTENGSIRIKILRCLTSNQGWDNMELYTKEYLDEHWRKLTKLERALQ